MTTSRFDGDRLPSTEAALAVAEDPNRLIDERLDAVALAAFDACGAAFDRLLALMRQGTIPQLLREAALEALQGASFSVLQFAPCRSDYLAALRDVSTDADPELRQRALGILAREKDPYARDVLLAGLRDPARALLPPAKALQLLSYDPHAEVYALARDILASPPDEEARDEALRLLAADPAAAPLLEGVLRDRAEGTSTRQIAASALTILSPRLMQQHARAIVLDRDEDDELQASSLTALAHFGDRVALAADDELREHLQRARTAASGLMRRGARRFLRRQRP